MVKIPKIKKQHAALLIITIISILVIVTLVRNGNKTEEYDTGKVKEDLLDYIENKEGELVGIEVMKRTSRLTDDEEKIEQAYDYAITGARDNLADLIESL
tara:strand:+ start:114 stop:413 length:300 start_codon:yes stop_codon:yes gene_type:complete